MGDIKITVSGDVTTIRVVGVVTADEVLHVVGKSYAGHVTNNVIWVIPKGSARKLTSDDLRDLARFVLARSHERAGGKTALVAPDDFEFGMGRMASAFAELIGTPVEVRTFRTLSEAAEWMGVAQLPAIEDMIE